jgi:hypothetical protein
MGDISLHTEAPNTVWCVTAFMLTSKRKKTLADSGSLCFHVLRMLIINRSWNLVVLKNDPEISSIEE